MSREKYRARSKKVQKLGRDGLVEKDKATGQEERISQRTADISFGPERSQEQAAGRALSQRTPTQGRRRKQPRPSPSPEPVVSADGAVLDMPEIAPAMRQVDDVPTAAPPPRTDGASSNKRRQQKRANRLNTDTPSHPMVEDSADGGRLHFEPGHDPPADTANQEGAELTAPRGADDAPMRERPPGGHSPSSTPWQAEGGGRLHFEAERPPSPAAPNARMRRTVGADTPMQSQPHEGVSSPDMAGDQDTGLTRRQQERHEKAEDRLHFEAERPPSPADPNARTRRTAGANTPVQPQSHGGTSAPDTASDPATGLTRRQQTQYEKAEGRLHFEAERPPSPAAPNAQMRRTPGADTPVQTQSHGGTSAPDTASDQDTGPTRRQQERQEKAAGRLHFEAEHPLSPAAPNAQMRRTAGADTPMQPQSHEGTSAPDTASDQDMGPTRRQQTRQEKAAGRLRFEAERSPSPAAPNAQMRRTPGADTPVQTQSHGGTSAPDTASDPAKGLTRRQQKRYEKAERRVEQSGRKLEKAQAKLPSRRRAHLEKEYDANSGKIRHRLRFETEVLPETVKPSIPAQVGHTMKTAAVMKVHGKIRENERDNVALEAAHKGEFAAEQGAGRFLRWNKQRLRSKPYRAVRQAERRLHTDQTRLAWQTALRDNPELRRKNILSKWIQKQKIKRKYAQAARDAQKTAQHTQQTVTAAGKIIRAIQQYAAAHKSALLIVAALALVISFFSAGLASCTAMLSGVQSSFLSATYLADEQEICNSELYFTELETDLQLDISSTEANYPGYDEYRYNIGDISHNPYELMSYLSAAYGVFTFEQVRPELDRLFGEKYQLTRTPVTETRYDDDGQPYEWTVLQTTLTVGRLGDTIAANLTPGEQTERYSAYMEGCGNRQAFANPFDFPWLGYVSSGYGWRVHPITGLKNLHRGVDIAAAQGTAIKAVQDGRVVSAGDMGSYGLCVVIEDDKGYQSRYAHCSSLSVSAGQEVKRGDVIGTVGSTGSSTGPHLHLEVMLDGEYLNPYYFVDTGGSGDTLGPVIPDYPGEAPTTETFAAMLAEAEKYLGYPYVWGGSSPSTSFDCSGFVSWVINHSGWSVGRRGAQGLYNICTPVSAANAQPGDLVFFWHTYDAPNPNGVTHVGIYVGNGQMIHCGNPISYANLNSTYWVNHFYGFGRLPEP